MKLDSFKKDELLSKHTTFKVGGPAKYFFEAKKESDIIQAIKIVQKNKIAFFILGGGSNVLFSDNGFDGLVLKVCCNKIVFDKSGVVDSDAGVLLARVIVESIKRGFTGLEFLAGIPGTLGGAVFGNAGLGKDGCCIGDVIKKVKLLMTNGKIKEVDKSWMKFFYRRSRLKDLNLEKRPIILSVELELKRGDKKELRKAVEEKISNRFSKYPTKPSAGCIFKNLPDAPAARLIDQCGLKGKKVGGAQVSKKHANFIINAGKATAQDVSGLIDLIKKEVKKKFKVKLEEEIQII